MLQVCNSESLPGMGSQLVCNLQMFSQVYRAKLTSIKQFGHQFDWVIQVCIIIQITIKFIGNCFNYCLEPFCQIPSTHTLLSNRSKI